MNQITKVSNLAKANTINSTPSIIQNLQVMPLLCTRTTRHALLSIRLCFGK